MLSKITTRLTCICFIALSAATARGADPQPLLAIPGKLLFQDDFSRSELGPTWKVGMGFFSIENGVLRGAENPADHHGGFAKTRFDFKDVVAEFSFKVEGATSFNFTMDDSAYKASHAGHICRVSVYPTQVYLGDMKFGSMKNEVYEKLHDPKSTPEEKKEVQASIKDKSATFKRAIDPANWHQARVEIVGDEMLVSIDGKVAGYLKSEGIGHPSKNLLGFTILGKSALLANVKVWEATGATDWASRRSGVVEGIGK